MPKLVAGEGKDGQLVPSFAVLLVQLHQLGVVGLGQASLRSNIDHDANLTLIFTKVDLKMEVVVLSDVDVTNLLPINILCSELVD